MKPWLLFLSMSAAMATTQAAPARKVARPQWEYAVLDISVPDNLGVNSKYGSRLFLPGKKGIWLPSAEPSSSENRAYLLNRLGSQGWELVTTAGYNDNEQRFYFKRLK